MNFLDKLPDGFREVFELVNSFLADYAVLRTRPMSSEQKERLENLLIQTYMQALREPRDMIAVHQAIMRNEEMYPVPATIRKYIRALNLVERDVDEEAGI